MIRINFVFGRFRVDNHIDFRAGSVVRDKVRIPVANAGVGSVWELTYQSVRKHLFEKHNQHNKK